MASSAGDAGSAPAAVSDHRAAANESVDEPANRPANETVYINNLNERVPLAQLKAELRALCSEFGPVRDIVARKALRKRGQAFVVFDSAADAARALAQLHGREWHAKPMRAAYARTQSDAHVPDEKLRVRKQKRELRRSRREDSGPSAAPPAPAGAAAAAAAARVRADRGEPHNVLFLEQIPAAVTPASLAETFKSVPGFRESRMFAIKHLGFVEFESVAAATAALDHWAATAAAPDVGRMAFAKK